ncbi:MAG: hypothetical protein R3232_11105, partial [Clostridia bacterium]|nr:hypothetical protein [Clostridia bacterium]
FEGKSHFSDKICIGTTSPDFELEVDDHIRVEGSFPKVSWRDTTEGEVPQDQRTERSSEPDKSSFPVQYP